MSQSDKPKARDPRVDAILDKVEQLEAQNQELQAKLNHQVKRAHRLADRIGESAGVDRRTVLAYLLGGGTTAAAILSQQPQRARAAGEFVQTDTVRNLSGTDVLDIADPIQALRAFAYNNTAISSATTVQEANVIEYDPSVSGFTITIGNTLEERGLPVILQETGGSSNSVTVDTQSGNNIDGSPSITLQKANARTVLFFEGGEWRTNFFIDTVDARTISTDKLGSGGGLVSSDLTNIEGTNLSVDGSGNLNAASGVTEGQLFLSAYDSTTGSGSITDNSGVVEIREPGNASAKDESRIYSHILEYDPSTSGSIRANIQNITIDNNASAVMMVTLLSAPDNNSVSGSGGDALGMRVEGNGDVLALTQQDGTGGSSDDTTQDNAFASALNYIKISWDGSSLTAEASDGTTTVTVSDNSNYPSGETLHLKIAAFDTDGANARKVDFDVDSVEVT